MLIESTHTVRRMEHYAAVAARLSDDRLRTIIGRVERQLERMPDFAYGSNRHEQLLRRCAVYKAAYERRTGRTA